MPWSGGSGFDLIFGSKKRGETISVNRGRAKRVDGTRAVKGGLGAHEPSGDAPRVSDSKSADDQIQAR